MKIIKRNGSEMPFDSGKIYAAMLTGTALSETVLFGSCPPDGRRPGAH